jgi:predicted metal-dependent phosphoesterase TrpH
MDVVNTIAAQILALLELDENTLFLVKSLEQIKERHENFIEESKHRLKQARAPHANPSDLGPARSQRCPRSG